MSLYAELQQRAAEGKPLRVGLIGAGKFGAMYLAQVPKTPGVHLAGHRRPRARERAAESRARRLEARALRSRHRSTTRSRSGTTHVGDDWQALVAHPRIDIVVECTGNPIAAVEHCLAAFRHGKHVVNVTVEADAFCGPLLARKAAEAGVVYSLAFGDQPALICDLVDWARTAGFAVVAAGRGHKWLPHFAQSTPETVWGYYGLTPEQARVGGLNPKMFNSFLDGSKPAIEMHRGLQRDRPRRAAGRPAPIRRPRSTTFPRCAGRARGRRAPPEGTGRGDLVARARRHADRLRHPLRRVRRVRGRHRVHPQLLQEYMVHTDPSGRYACLYKRWHLIGLEVGISVASVGLRGEATGGADVLQRRRRRHRQARSASPARCSTAKAATRCGASCCRPRRRSRSAGLPLGLAHEVKVARPVAQGPDPHLGDVAIEEGISRSTAFAARWRRCSPPGDRRAARGLKRSRRWCTIVRHQREED